MIIWMAEEDVIYQKRVAALFGLALFALSTASGDA